MSKGNRKKESKVSIAAKLSSERRIIRKEEKV